MNLMDAAIIDKCLKIRALINRLSPRDLDYRFALRRPIENPNFAMTDGTAFNHEEPETLRIADIVWLARYYHALYYEACERAKRRKEAV